MAKICKECGAPRGTPHTAVCSSAAFRTREVTKAKPAAVLVSRLPLKKSDITEGLAVSRGSGRVVYHTPMDRAPPGLPEIEQPEPPVKITDLRQLLENNTWGSLSDKLACGTVEYADPAIDAGEREATEDEVVVFRDVDGRPQLYMPVSIYHEFAERLKEEESGPR